MKYFLEYVSGDAYPYEEDYEWHLYGINETNTKITYSRAATIEQVLKQVPYLKLSIQLVETE